jgi:hypothetical protein
VAAKGAVVVDGESDRTRTWRMGNDMKRSLLSISVLALLLSMLALPAGAQPPEQAGQCEGFNTDAKLDVEDFVGDVGTWEDVPGDDGNLYTVKGTLNADGTVITFEVYDENGELVEDATVKFCVKGGGGPGGAAPPNYYDGATSGTTSTGQEISNVVVYLVYIPNGEEECDWVGETAWSDGDRYTKRGNWATYTPYVGVEKTVTLYAGQTLDAGVVTFSAPFNGEVEVSIELNDGWRFEDVAENVKIQDYTTAPSGNPAPGLFAHKGDASGSAFTIVVPENNFYGVHVNVEWKQCD